VRLLLDQPWAATVGRIEAGLRAGLAPAATASGVADLRVLGAIGVIETREPLPMAAMQQISLDHGVWLRPFGRLVYTMPPYISNDADIERITAAMLAIVDRLAT
jgi:adenosylmethionine-8-amino-7-oxononanoate aminotransferase